MSYNFSTEKKKTGIFPSLVLQKRTKAQAKYFKLFLRWYPLKKNTQIKKTTETTKNQIVLTDLHFRFFLLYKKILQHLGECMEAYKQDPFVLEWPDSTKTHRMSKANRPSSQQTDPVFRYKTWPSFI